MVPGERLAAQPSQNGSSLIWYQNPEGGASGESRGYVIIFDNLKHFCQVPL